MTPPMLSDARVGEILAHLQHRLARDVAMLARARRVRDPPASHRVDAPSPHNSLHSQL